MAAPHERHAVVWDVPTAVERGATFAVKVGVKCAAGCAPCEWRVEVYDHDGHLVASSLVGKAPWPGTAALYYTELALTAPIAEGLFAWHVAAPSALAQDRSVSEHGESEHEAARAVFNVRVSPPAECRLTVVAVDRETRALIARAKVVIHPYRTLTDDRGVAVLRVPNGPYRLFVSGRDYFPFRRDDVASGDATVYAELETDTGPSEEELWA